MWFVYPNVLADTLDTHSGGRERMQSQVVRKFMLQLTIQLNGTKYCSQQITYSANKSDSVTSIKHVFPYDMLRLSQIAPKNYQK